MKFSPYGSPIPLVFAGKFHPEILRGSPRAGASNKGGVGKTSHFLDLNVNMSKTVADAAKVTINDLAQGSPPVSGTCRSALSGVSSSSASDFLETLRKP